MKRILIPVDFSPYSEVAMRAGIMLSKETGARLLLVHVLRISPDWMKLSVDKQQKFPEIEASLVEAQIKMERFANHRQFRNIQVETFVEGGVVYDEIVRLADLYKVELIIMGAYGNDDSKKTFIGSTAQRLLRRANCPVLSVKKDFKKTKIKRILVVSDLTESSRPALDFVKKLSRDLKARIEVVYINTPATFNNSQNVTKGFDRLNHIFEDEDVTYYLHNDYDLSEGISNFLEQNKPDLVVMAAHHRRGKAYYVVGITEAVIYRSDIPVLSVGI
ncbi:MAG: universal stress protein [Flammeovirgaceae bacterium]|nr:universal stress protein [Flammeovirgaceae bacterium]